MTCVIPQALADELGIGHSGTDTAVYADGSSAEVPVSEPVRFELLGRSVTEDCLILGDEVLIGQTVLERADVFIDAAGKRIVGNPDHPDKRIIKIRTVA